MTTNRSHASKRRSLLQKIKDLVDELAELEIDEADARGARTADPRTRSKSKKDPTFETGDRVQLIRRRDKHFRRYGCIIGPRGEMYWDIVLDRFEGEPSGPAIYRAATSLRLMEDDT